MAAEPSCSQCISIAHLLTTSAGYLLAQCSESQQHWPFRADRQDPYPRRVLNLTCSQRWRCSSWTMQFFGSAFQGTASCLPSQNLTTRPWCLSRYSKCLILSYLLDFALLPIGTVFYFFIWSAAWPPHSSVTLAVVPFRGFQGRQPRVQSLHWTNRSSPQWRASGIWSVGRGRCLDSK